MKKTTMAMFCVAGASLCAHAQTGTNYISSDISVDTTWTSNIVYIIDRPVFVKDGATLTVHAGTVIRGLPKTAATPGPGTLVVSRGSKIRMLGTPQAPIVMTGSNDNHYVGPTPGPGTAPWNTPNNLISKTWGGLILLGRTYIATVVGTVTSPNSTLTMQIEGLTPYGELSRYGGGDDDDDSGELRYVSIRYGAFVLGTDNEINGLTCGAVGRGTDIRHIEVYQNADDAFEFFGSTCNAKYLVGWADGDDGIDWDEGYRGKLQFVLRVQGFASTTDRSDKGAEMDGATGLDRAQPSACPTVYNATFVGLGKDSGNMANAVLHFRDGSGGRYYNSLFMDFGGAPALIEGALGDAIYDSADLTQSNYVKNAFYTHDGGGKMLEIANCTFWNMGTNVAIHLAPSSGVANVYGAASGDKDLPHYGYPLFSDPSLSNTLAGGSSAPVVELTRSSTPITHGGRQYYPVELLDPTLPSGSPLLTGGRRPPEDGFFTPVRHVGAFGTKNWAEWTLVNKLGLMESDNYGEYVDPTISDAFVAATIRFPTMAGATYAVQYTTNEATMGWVNLTTNIVGTGADYLYTDQRPITEARQYRVLSGELGP